MNENKTPSPAVSRYLELDNQFDPMAFANGDQRQNEIVEQIDTLFNSMTNVEHDELVLAMLSKRKQRS